MKLAAIHSCCVWQPTPLQGGTNTPKGRQKIKVWKEQPCVTLFFFFFFHSCVFGTYSFVICALSSAAVPAERRQKYLQHAAGCEIFCVCTSVKVHCLMGQICMPTVIVWHNPSPRAQGLQGWNVAHWFMICRRPQYQRLKLDLLGKSFSVVGYSVINTSRFFSLIPFSVSHSHSLRLTFCPADGQTPP